MNNPQPTDIADISSSYWLGVIAKSVDNNEMIDLFKNEISGHSTNNRRESPGLTQFRFRHAEDRKVWKWWESISLRGWTMGIEINCTVQNKSDCGGTCKAKLQLYDYYDFEPNGTIDWIPYIIVAGPEYVGGVTPFHVFAEWSASYVFDNNFKITKIKNSAY